MSSNTEKEEWNANEEEFREEEERMRQEEEYDDNELGADEEELQAEEYDDAQYSGDDQQEYEELEYEDELKQDGDIDVDGEYVDEYDDQELELIEEEDLDSEVKSKSEEYVDEYYMKKQRDLSRQMEEDRKTSLFQQKICSLVLCLSIMVTLWLTFWIPNRIVIDTSDFSVRGSTPSIIDNGDEYEVSFKGLGEVMFTNNNAPLVRMTLAGFSLHARFLCDTPEVSSSLNSLCESIENGTTTSPFHPMSTWHRGTAIVGTDGKKQYELRIPKAIASSLEIREIMEASCEQNKNFRVQFRAEAEILHDFSGGFSLPITDIPTHTFECVQPNQKKESGILSNIL